MNINLSDIAYHRQIANLITALDKPNFWLLLTRTLKTFLDFDNWVALRFSNHGRPLVYTENPSVEGVPDLLFQDYLNGLYLFDPFFVASRSRSESGLFFLDDVAPENFLATDYYRLYFQRNIVADEVQFNYAMENGETLCFSMGRATKYQAAEIAILSLISPWIVGLMQQRQHFEGSVNTVHKESSSNHWHENVEHAINDLKGAKLTVREVEISQLMLSGHLSKNIADALNISIETVRAHKKHIYTKLKINSQSELFAIFYQAQNNNQQTNV